MKIFWILLFIVGLCVLGCGGGDDAGMGKDDPKAPAAAPSSGGPSTEGEPGTPDSVSPPPGG